MPIEPRPPRTSSPLPPYRAVLAVDVEGYTRNPALHQQVLSATIPTVLEDAFVRSGMEDVWKDSRFPQRSGDGYVIGVEPENLPFLVHPFLGTLQETLEDAQPNLASHDRDLRLRLRASIDVGPLPDSPDDQRNPIDGIGRAMNDTHRLLDSPPVREELRLSDRDATLVVAIISSRVYEAAVLDGFVGVKTHRFRPVDAELQEKGFRQDGYLYVPVPTRGPVSPGDAQDPRGAVDEPAGSAPPAAPEAGAADTPTVSRMGDNYGQAVQGGSIQGGVHGDFRGRRDG